MGDDWADVDFEDQVMRFKTQNLEQSVRPAHPPSRWIQKEEPYSGNMRYSFGYESSSFHVFCFRFRQCSRFRSCHGRSKTSKHVHTVATQPSKRGKINSEIDRVVRNFLKWKS